MRAFRQHAIACLAGFGIASAAVWLMGWLAAVPVPRGFFDALRGHPDLAFLLHTTLLVQVPAALLAFVVGVALFRVLGRASGTLLLVAVAPWLLEMALSLLTFLAGDSAPSVSLGQLLGWRSLPGTLSVPAGLWLAARVATPRATRGGPPAEPQAASAA